MVFLEHNVDRPLGNRLERWWAAFTGSGTVYLPLVIADSGHGVSNGSLSYAAVYRAMVDAELARPPEARVEAWSRRVGNTMRVYATVTNLTDDTLSFAANQAGVTALVWEEHRAGVTRRTVRAAPHVTVSEPLAPGSSLAVTLDSGAITVVDWNKVHAVAFADYRPLGLTGAWDMPQAAAAVAPALVSAPTSLALTVVPGQPATATATLALAGPGVATWTAAGDRPWLEVTPAGGLPGEAVVTVRDADLPPGAQTATVTFTGASTDGLALTCTVPVTATLAQPPADGRPVRRRLSRAGG